MATATRKEDDVEVIVKPGGFVLELDSKEALVLATVLSRVGGSPSDSYRSESQKILNALESSGTNYFNEDVRYSLTGHLVFGDHVSNPEGF